MDNKWQFGQLLENVHSRRNFVASVPRGIKVSDPRRIQFVAALFTKPSPSLLAKSPFRSPLLSSPNLPRPLPPSVSPPPFSAAIAESEEENCRNLPFPSFLPSFARSFRHSQFLSAAPRHILCTAAASGRGIQTKTRSNTQGSGWAASLINSTVAEGQPPHRSSSVCLLLPCVLLHDVSLLGLPKQGIAS